MSRCEAFAEPRRDIIEFADFIESMVSDADFEATARKGRVSVLRAETCRLAGDRELLREAIENVLRNALRYTPAGTAVTVDAYRDGLSGCRANRARRDLAPHRGQLAEVNSLYVDGDSIPRS